MHHSSARSNTPMIVFGEDWGALPSSTQHLIRGLQYHHPVLWVNSMGLRRPRLCRHDLTRLWTKGKQLLAGSAAAQNPPINDPACSKRQADNLPEQHQPRVIEPHTLPLPGNPLAGLINRSLLGQRIRSLCADQQMERPIMWTSLPSAVDLVGALNERAVVYYCGDDFGALCGVDHRAVLEQERALVAKADLVLVASERLAQRFPAHKTRLLPHGVDFEHFSSPVAPAADLPTGKPVAGFYGSLSDWIDVELLADTARLHPHWHFCLIGQVQTDVTPLKALANVHLLGPRRHDQLPSYLQHWQAALLPFRDTPQIRACNPLKLREYLASGTAVISTDFPALNGYRDLVSVISPQQSFARALQQSQDEPAWLSGWRRQRVRTESWQQRCQQVEAMLAELN